MARFVNIDIIKPEPYEVQVGGRVFDLAATDLTGTAEMARVIQRSVREADSTELTMEGVADQLDLFADEVDAMAALLGKDADGEKCTGDWLRTVLNSAQLNALMEACVEFVMFGGDPDPKGGSDGEPTV